MVYFQVVEVTDVPGVVAQGNITQPGNLLSSKYGQPKAPLKFVFDFLPYSLARFVSS